MDDLLKEFLTETLESLALLDAEIVRLEQAPDDPKLVNGIFRVLHTIKGTCGFLPLPRLEAVAHAGESVLARLRDGQLTADGTTVSLILACLDQIRLLLDTLEIEGAEPAGEDRELIQSLEALVAGPEQAACAAAEPDTSPANDGAAAAPAASAEMPPEAGERSMPALPARHTIRVNLAVVDRLMTLTSELVLCRNQLMRQFGDLGGGEESDPLQRLSALVSELQDSVARTRMQPIGEAWSNLPRVVRDLARDLDKEVTLVQSGAETELDRQVLELVRDPLTHMVRNAVDHGLEDPVSRLMADKPRTGTIGLKAYHEAGHIVVEVSDDGRGLSIDSIRQKALDLELASERQLAAMSDRQAARFIFDPGFSTAAQVTSVSGRGVGMDVVLNNIERIGGTVDLWSKPSQGTTFRVKIPLTLAIVSALLVESAGRVFALPQLAVIELLRLDSERRADLSWVRDVPVLRRQGRLVPLVCLRELLQMAPKSEGAAGAANGLGAYVAILQAGAQRFGLLLDRVLDIEEIVIKPVAPILQALRVFSGNAILGDGRVAMILEPNAIAAKAGVPAFADVADPEADVAALPAPAQAEDLLVFRAGSGRMALSLSRVVRLEEVDLASLQRTGDRLLLPYRGGLLPLITLDPASVPPARGLCPVVVLAASGRRVGLLAERILDIVEQPVSVEPETGRPGWLGSALIEGKVTDILDADYFLVQAVDDGREAGVAVEDDDLAKQRLLLVDDSPFFRDLLTPLLIDAGYRVTAVEGAEAALRLCAAGERYDAIVTDIDMPEMDGFALAQEVRQDPRWCATPLFALTSHGSTADVARGRAAGFDDYIVKNEGEGLLKALAETLPRSRGAS